MINSHSVSTVRQCPVSSVSTMAAMAPSMNYYRPHTSEGRLEIRRSSQRTRVNRDGYSNRDLDDVMERDYEWPDLPPYRADQGRHLSPAYQPGRELHPSGGQDKVFRGECLPDKPEGDVPGPVHSRPSWPV